jgi:hypothetical protein
MTGRPSSFTAEIGHVICTHLANGGSLREWCAIEGNPHFSTVYDWLEREEGFADAYARAREVQAHNDGDRMNQIVQKLERGTIDPNAARVMIDALKWTAGKRMPKVYGDRLQVGGDTGAPLVVSWLGNEKL